MPDKGHGVSLEEQIERWRSYLRRRQAIHSVDVAELEDHLREQVAVLVEAGLATDEAFLVAVKRMGNLDALSREFAREHSDRLWKQLVVVPSDSGEPRARARTDAIVAYCLAVVAAVVIKVPALFGIQLDQDAGFYARNLSLFVLPLLTGYFVWKRRLDTGTLRWLAVAFVAAGGFFQIFSLPPRGCTPGASGPAPPAQVVFLGAMLWTGRGVGIERNVLIAFDLLLVVVLGLLLYSVSARDPHSPPGAFDVVQIVLVVSALVADAVALWAIAARITEFGFSPNRVAALGENVILLVNLAYSAVLYVRFLRGRGSFSGLERWQTAYLPVYAVWAAIVVIVFPPLFGYV